MEKKNILIMGADGGIGSAISDRLEKDGARVFRHGKTGEYSADVRSEKELIALIDRVIDEAGRIDAVVNSLSAPIELKSLEKKKWADFLSHFDVQLKAAVVLANVLIPKMKEQGSGQFINILSSVVLDVPPPKYSDYVTAKYAMLGFSKCLAEELKESGISVHCVSPDFVKTGLTKIFPEKLGEILAAKNKTKKLTEPSDVAKAVSNLISGKIQASHILISGGAPEIANG